jgi:hypothetical protein
MIRDWLRMVLRSNWVRWMGIPLMLLIWGRACRLIILNWLLAMIWRSRRDSLLRTRKTLRQLILLLIRMTSMNWTKVNLSHRRSSIRTTCLLSKRNSWLLISLNKKMMKTKVKILNQTKKENDSILIIIKLHHY